MKLPVLSNQRGMTLLEVLVAFIILTMALVTMMNAFVLGSRQNTGTNCYNTALSLAQSKMEEIKHRNFNSVTDVTATDFSSETDYSGFTGYSYTVTVDDGGLNLKTVTVAVTYSEGGVSKEVSVTTDVVKR